MPMKLRFLPALALAALLLAGCEPTCKYLPREFFDSSTFREYKTALNEEAQDCVQHYLRTGEAGYATPQHHITLLHLAAISRRLWLMDELLMKGADANALMQVGDDTYTPLALALKDIPSGGYHDPVRDSLVVINRLAESGASAADVGSENALMLCVKTYCTRYAYAGQMGGEELALRLMALGAGGGRDEALSFCRIGWAKALERLLHECPQADALRHDAELLHACADGLLNERGYLQEEHEQGIAACAELLLKGGIPVDAPDAEGKSLLEKLARNIHGAAAWREHDFFPLIATLLRHGAETLAPCGVFGKCCVADFLAGKRELAEYLKEHEVAVPSPPPHHFEADTLVEQLLDIPGAAITKEEVDRQLKLLESLFAAPTPKQVEEPMLHRQACVHALCLMHDTNAERTQEFIFSLPITEPAAWQGEAFTARGLLYALQQNKGIVLPADSLLVYACHMNDAGRADVAHAFARLMGRDESEAAKKLIETCCAEGTRAAIRAAALSCKVNGKGLPALGEVAAMYPVRKSKRGGLNPPVRLARMADRSARCVSRNADILEPERLFYTGCGLCEGPPDPKTTDALRELGAPLAAAWYESCEGDAAEASLELEAVLALFILAHEEEFRNPHEEERGMKR